MKYLSSISNFVTVTGRRILCWKTRTNRANFGLPSISNALLFFLLVSTRFLCLSQKDTCINFDKSMQQLREIHVSNKKELCKLRIASHQQCTFILSPGQHKLSLYFCRENRSMDLKDNSNEGQVQPKGLCHCLVVQLCMCPKLNFGGCEV